MADKVQTTGEELLSRVGEAQKVLVGLGAEWNGRAGEDLKPAYEALAKLLAGKDYFIVTVNVDGEIFHSSLDGERITAPCGNLHWFQCQAACTADIWEEGEVPDEICPHCGAPLTGNTIEANPYIEEGYLPSWEAYKKWQAATLNRSLLILELGEGFRTPTVMRWPFEKTAYFNKKAFLCRVNKGICQIPKEIGEKGAGICMDSLEFVRCLAAESAGE